MNSYPPHQEDELNYALQPGVGVVQTTWPPEDIYNPLQSDHTGSQPPYAMSQVQPISQRPWTPHAQSFPEHAGANYPHPIGTSYQPHNRSPRQVHSAHYAYQPGSSPRFSLPGPIPVQHSEMLPSRGSSRQSMMVPYIDETLPQDVRAAMEAAFASSEWSSGENVSADILMPIVQKMGKDCWACRICGKEHKRRDHTFTHVRTAHLDNKGWRCTHEDCGAAFGRKGDLERHVNSTHQSSYEAVCPHCNSHLHRRDNLTRHMKTCKVANGLEYLPSQRPSRRNESQAYPYPMDD